MKTKTKQFKDSKLETKILKLSEIKSNPKNPKLHADDLIEKSIKETGYISPIVVDENNIILSGGSSLATCIILPI